MDKNTKFVATFGICILILISYFPFFFRPKIKELGQLKKKGTTLNVRLQEIDKEIAEQERLAERYLALKEERDKLKMLFSKDEEMSLFLEYISKVARDTRIKIVQITPLEEKQLNKQKMIEVPILIKAQGPYHQLGHFVNQLEIGSRLVLIHELNISSNPSDIHSHTVSMLVSMFILKQT